MEAAMTDAAARVQELLERIASDSGVDAKVRVREDDEGVTGEFVGEDLGLLIGHHGQTIDAIQHVAYRIAFRGAAARKRVVVDAAGYRERRAVALRAAAGSCPSSGWPSSASKPAGCRRTAPAARSG